MSSSYSFSKIGSFETCKLQYKYRYIDKLPHRVETIEAFTRLLSLKNGCFLNMMNYGKKTTRTRSKL